MAGRRIQGTSTGTTVGYSVENISYDNKSSSYSSQNTYMLGLGFNADGTKMYRTGYSPTKAIFQYSLSTAWDISTASYDNVSFSLPSPVSVPYGFEWNGDGTKFVLCDTSTGNLYQFSLSTAYDISTTNSTPATYDPSETSTPDAIKFNSDGTKAFVIGQSNDTVYRYSLSTAYDITTMSYDSNYFTYTSTYYITGLEFNSDGTEMYLQDHINNYLRRYTLSTAYDLSTASLTSSFSTSSQFSSQTSSSLTFSADGTKLYISGYGASDQQYSTATTASDRTVLTNVQSGSRFEETDTRKIYYGALPSPTYEDNFTSDNWTESSGSRSQVDTGNGWLYFDTTPDGGNDSTAIQISGGTTSFVMEWDMRVTSQSESSGANSYGFFGVSSANQDTNHDTGQEYVGLKFGGMFEFGQVSGFSVTVDTGATKPQSAGSPDPVTYDWVNDTTVYCRMIYDGSNITVECFTGSMDGTSVGSSTTSTSGVDLSSTAYIKLGNLITSNAYYYKGNIQNLKFYNGITSTNLTWTEEV